MLKIGKKKQKTPKQWLHGKQVWEMLNCTKSTRFPQCLYYASGPHESPRGAYNTQHFLDLLACKPFPAQDSQRTKGSGTHFGKGCSSSALLMQTLCLRLAISKWKRICFSVSQGESHNAFSLRKQTPQSLYLGYSCDRVTKAFIE